MPFHSFACPACATPLAAELKRRHTPVGCSDCGFEFMARAETGGPRRRQEAKPKKKGSKAREHEQMIIGGACLLTHSALVLREVSGSGRGWIALHALEPGTELWREAPLTFAATREELVEAVNADLPKHAALCRPTAATSEGEGVVHCNFFDLGDHGAWLLEQTSMLVTPQPFNPHLNLNLHPAVQVTPQPVALTLTLTLTLPPRTTHAVQTPRCTFTCRDLHAAPRSLRRTRAHATQARPLRGVWRAESSSAFATAMPRSSSLERCGAHCCTSAGASGAAAHAVRARCQHARSNDGRCLRRPPLPPTVPSHAQASSTPPS